MALFCAVVFSFVVVIVVVIKSICIIIIIYLKLYNSLQTNDYY